MHFTQDPVIWRVKKLLNWSFVGLEFFGFFLVYKINNEAQRQAGTLKQYK